MRRRADYLQSLYEGYFSAGEEDQEAQDLLLAQFAEWRRISLTIGDTPYPFTSIHHHLKVSLQRPDEEHSPYALNGVRFCSLHPMRAIPAKVIAMLGMSEGCFPRHDGHSSLNLMQQSSQSDYCPSHGDYDRFLFLETLLSAQRYLLITYCGISADDGKEQPPALVVEELLSYLDKAYILNDKKPSQICCDHHPVHAFDKRYFSADSSLRNYIPHHFSAACAYYHVDKEPVESFLSSFAIHMAPTPSQKPLRITLKALTDMARHPIKSYFNKTLGIYIESAEKRLLKNEEELHLSTLQQYILRKEMLHTPLEKLLQKAEREGTLPMGAFKGVAIDTLKREIEELHRSLHSVGVDIKQIGKITLQSHCNAPTQNAEGHWQLPPLRLTHNEREIQIIGELPAVSPQGLIATMRDEKADILKIWPQFLALNCVASAYSLPLKPDLLSLTNDKAKVRSPFFADPQKQLSTYLDYYFAALQHASPLMPEWVSPLLQDAASLQKKIEERLESRFQHPDEYLAWSFKARSLDASEMITHWQPQAQMLFQEMYNSWFGEKEQT